MNILVTGGAGYIGSHTVKLLLARGHDVTVFDSLVYGHRAAVPADRLVVGDLADVRAVDRVLAERRVEAVVHFAAFDYAGAYPFGYCALRYFNAAGAAPDGSIGEDHDPETHLIPLVFQAAMGKRADVQIFGTDYPTPDGTCVRDYIHVDDLAEAHILALDKLGPGARLKYNVGTGRGY